MEALAQELFPKMLAFVEKAGALAVEKQATAAQQLKADKSVVTETDLAISKMCHEMFDDYFERDDHTLIDEEIVDQLGTPEEVIGKYTYTWVLDPIDGTAPYANGRNTWGIIFGILKNDAPWLGIVYMPARQELFLCDGEQTWMEKNPFTAQAQKKPITPVDMDIQKHTFFELATTDLAYVGAFQELCLANTSESAAESMVTPVVGQSCGCMFKRWAIWDFAGGWPIVKAAGLEFRQAETGDSMQEVRPEYFKENWKSFTPWVLSSEKNFPIFQEKLLPVIAQKKAT